MVCVSLVCFINVYGGAALHTCQVDKNNCCAMKNRCGKWGICARRRFCFFSQGNIGQVPTVPNIVWFIANRLHDFIVHVLLAVFESLVVTSLLLLFFVNCLFTKLWIRLIHVGS